MSKPERYPDEVRHAIELARKGLQRDQVTITRELLDNHAAAALLANYIDERIDKQDELLERLRQQAVGSAESTYSKGKLAEADEGDLAMAVGSDPASGLVRIDFGKPVRWLQMEAPEAVELIQTLIKHTRAVATEPFSISIDP